MNAPSVALFSSFASPCAFHACRFSSLFALLLLVFALLITGCDSGGDDKEPGGDPTGVWREVVDAGDFAGYIVVGEREVDFYTEGRYRGTCWIIAKWKILETDGSEYVMENESGSQSTFTIVREGERLTVDDFEYVKVNRSASEVEDIYPICPQSQE